MMELGQTSPACERASVVCGARSRPPKAGASVQADYMDSA